MATTKKRKPASASIPNAIGDIEDFSMPESLAIRSSLLRWYDENHRDLPWRTPIGVTNKSLQSSSMEDDEQRAYVVWVSEIMLQQTRVPTVVGYFNRWMEKWPTISELSSASLEEVNDMWAGLGYYRRARFLLEGAKSIVSEGTFPRSASALRGVRGIGDYTAGAIASIAFNEVVPVVDGNVVRVITRLKAISANPKETGTVKLICSKRDVIISFWASLVEQEQKWKVVTTDYSHSSRIIAAFCLGGNLVDPSRPGDFNQAIMELGSTLCTSVNPSCYQCPVADQCRALCLSKTSEALKVTDFPTKVAKTKQRHDFAAVSVVKITESDEQILNDSCQKDVFILVKRPENGLLAGLWEFPSVLLDECNMNQNTRRAEMDKYLKRFLKLDLGENCKVVLRQDVEGFKLNNKEDKSSITWKCVDENSIKNMGLTSGVRKVFNMTQGFKEKQEEQQKPIRMLRKKAKGLT